MRGRRAAILVGAGLLAVLAAASISWRLDYQSRTFLTDGAGIRRPAAAAPAREILWTSPARMPLGTGEDEYEPRVSADGQTLYFVRGRAGHNADILIARRTPDGWTPPEPLASINSEKDELGPEPSPDGASLYFASDRDGGAGGYDLWVSRFDGAAWGEPENLGPLNTAANEYNPALTPDGRTVYFSSNRARPGESPGDRAASWPGTVRENIPGHDFDLYRAPLDGSAPAEPVEALNTSANEGTPAFSPAADFVYFASDRAGGLGGFDLYRARLHQGEPRLAESLGAPVNSAANELDPTLEMGGFGLRFSSDRRPGAGESVAEAARDYNLFESVSREVYRITEPPSAARWASVLEQVLPWLIWFLLTLLLVLLIILLYRAQRNRHLSLLTRCLIGSAIVHLIILFLLSLWGVTTSMGPLFHKPGGTRVRLASAGTGDALAMQVRGTMPMAPAVITSVPPADAAVRTAPAVAAPLEMARSAPDSGRLDPSAPIPEATAPSRPPDQPPEPPTAAAPSVAVPEAAAARATDELALDVPLASSAPPDPSPQASEARITQLQPSRSGAPAPEPNLAGRDPLREAAPVSPDPAATSDLAKGSPGASEVATPAEAAGQSRPEPSVPARIADASVPEAGPSVEWSSPTSNAEAGLPGRSAPEIGRTLTGEATPREATANPVLPGAASGLALRTPTDAPDLNMPTEAAGASAQETASPAAIADTSTPEPGLAIGRSAPRQSAVADLPGRSAPGTGRTLAGQTPPRESVAGPAVPGSASGLALNARAEASDLATPTEGMRAIVEESGGHPGIASTATPEPGLAMGSSSPRPNAETGQPARSVPESGGTLVGSPESALSRPGAAPSTTADLNAGPAAFDLALPSESSPAEGTRVAAEARKWSPQSGETGTADPLLPMARGESSGDSPGAAPTGVEAGPSLATLPAPGLSAPAASESRRAAALEPGSPAFDLALPNEQAPGAGPAASAESSPQPGATPSLGASEPAAPLAKRAEPAGAPEPERAEIAPGASLATPREDVSPELFPESVPPASIAAALAPAEPGVDLALPAEVAPPEDQFAQRDAEHRMDIVERMGGSRETEEAVARSLAWLARHQSADGRWSSGRFDEHCGACGGGTKIESDNAVTGLALLAFLASDHTPNKDGPYRDRVDRALRWLLAQQKPSGDLRGDETMYSHGIATIAIAEAYAMTRDRSLAEPVRRAAEFIAGSRNSLDGGWRYEPGEAGDTSVLGWQAMALTSARRAGIAVPPDALASADRWLDSVSTDTAGWYAYQPGMPPTHAMTAEGMYVRQILGHARDEPIMFASVDRIMRNPPRWDERPSTYAWYYATLALFQHGGPEWDEWNALLTKELLTNQRTLGEAAGSWDPEDRWAQIGGRVYQTAICTLSLEVYYRYLPMYGVASAGGAPAPDGAPSGGTRPSP